MAEGCDEKGAAAAVAAAFPDYFPANLKKPSPAKRIVVKSADMDDEMQKAAIDCALTALKKHGVERDIAAYIKKEFDAKYGPIWHCIVGRNFGPQPIHCTQNPSLQHYWSSDHHVEPQGLRSRSAHSPLPHSVEHHVPQLSRRPCSGQRWRPKDLHCPYIVQVRPPSDLVLASSEDKAAWYKTFLPETTSGAGGDALRMVFAYSEVFSGFSARLSESELRAMTLPPTRPSFSASSAGPAFGSHRSRAGPSSSACSTPASTPITPPSR